jgi:hypothetical protein
MLSEFGRLDAPYVLSLIALIIFCCPIAAA